MEDQPSRARSACEGAEAHRLGLGSALLAAACFTLSGRAAPCPAVAPAAAEGSLHPSFFRRVSTHLPCFCPVKPCDPCLWHCHAPPLEILSCEARVLGPQAMSREGFQPFPGGRHHGLLSRSPSVPLGWIPAPPASVRLSCGQDGLLSPPRAHLTHQTFGFAAEGLGA